MKKLLYVLLIATILSITTFAADSDFVGENEFVLASYNGVKTFTKNDTVSKALEESTYWLYETKDTYNIKFVGFLGKLTSGAPYNLGMVDNSQSKLIEVSLADEGWGLQHKRLAESIALFNDVEIPIGVSPALEDYVPSGFSRDNLFSTYLPAEKYISEDYAGEALDEINSYVTIENNGIKYLVFSLELWPRASVLDWFNSVVEANPDKYVIVYTKSFINPDGAMYTMWDWNIGFKAEGTSQLKSWNLANIGNPRDGEGIWNYAFSKHDNILAVISSNVKSSADIITSKATNPRGIETALIGADAENGRNKLGPTVLLTKISADNTEITVAWATSGKELDESSIKAVKLDKIGTLKEPDISETLPQIPLQYNGANTAYIYGYEGNTFRPNSNMTRAEACTIFARLLLGKQTIPDGYKTRFEDVKTDDWFYNAIAYLDQTGFFYRLESNTYKPNEPITRAEFVELANFTSSLKGNKSAVFTDVPEDHFYYDSIKAAASSGLVNGYEDNTFRPDKTITRAEVVTVINRLLGLKVNEKTIDTSRLENEFVDVGSHWARLNVLMASNSSVHGAYYYSASLDGVTETSNDYTLTNKHFSIKLSKKDSKILEVINLYTGEDVYSHPSSSHFVYLTSESGSQIAPTKLETEGNRIKITFKNKAIAYMIVDVTDDYMTFEIDSELSSSLAKQITFARIVLNGKTANDGYFLNGIGMTAWTNSVNQGYREGARDTVAHAYTVYDTGIMGAKIGIAFSKKEDAISHLQGITDAIDTSEGFSSKAGGAYAREWEDNLGDYAFCLDLAPDSFDETVKLLREFDVDYYDVHQQDKGTFTQGDFSFDYTENGTAEEFYNKFGKKLNDAGIKTALHTYAYYISPASDEILSNPKWQKDLIVMESFTLRKDLSAKNRNITTVEDVTKINVYASFFAKTSSYVLIDEEIIKVGQGTDKGLINCVRGACGTTATTHKAGSEIKHLSGYFSMLVPHYGSELFYHIADRTADAYNKGGFDMLYVDAIDGLAQHLPEGTEVWYWFNAFMHRILSQCEKTPIVETSMGGQAAEWIFRGRVGAWDYANYSNVSLKQFLANHVEANKRSHTYNMTSTLGWFNFRPDADQALKNTFFKSMFTDVLDFLGTNAVLYDMSMVYNPFGVSEVNGSPYHKASISYYYNHYSKLRKSHYFKDEVLDKVKSIGGEWRIIEKNGKYLFQRRAYDFANLGNATGVDMTLEGNNIFMEQTPFIRIESRYSTLFENKQTLVELDETKPIGSNKVTKTFSAVNMTKNGLAVTVRVKGTGKDGDAMLLSLMSTNSTSSGRRDHFIDLNFEGWREFVLLDYDNADYDTERYVFAEVSTTGSSYATYRHNPSHSNITTLIIRTTGETGKNAMIDDVFYMTHSNAPVKNPTVKVGSQSITFNCEMKGGEYLEFYPETSKAILYHSASETTEEVTFTGEIKLASGKYTAGFSAEALTKAPVRARLTFGFSGQEIGN